MIATLEKIKNIYDCDFWGNIAIYDENETKQIKHPLKSSLLYFKKFIICSCYKCTTPIKVCIRRKNE